MGMRLGSVKIEFTFTKQDEDYTLEDYVVLDKEQTK